MSCLEGGLNFGCVPWESDFRAGKATAERHTDSK